jgi:hypothetical protein
VRESAQRQDRERNPHAPAACSRRNDSRMCTGRSAPESPLSPITALAAHPHRHLRVLSAGAYTYRMSCHRRFDQGRCPREKERVGCLLAHDAPPSTRSPTYSLAIPAMTMAMGCVTAVFTMPCMICTSARHGIISVKQKKSVVRLVDPGLQLGTEARTRLTLGRLSAERRKHS